MSLLIKNATVLTMNDRFEIVHGAVSIRDGRIAAVGVSPDAHDRVIDAAGGFVLPGLVQTHVHLCQTLFRGYADDLALMDWLRTRVWQMEAAHTRRSLAAAGRLAAAELLRTGTTTVLTMETVHDTDAVCEAVAPTGLRATIGKCMMDAPEEGVPARLAESMAWSIDESLALHRAWHGASNGRLRVALAPRFAVSCSRGLLEAVAALGLEHEIGSVEIGKRADLIVVDTHALHLAPVAPDPYSALVYAARGTDVSTTIVDGEVLMENGRLTRLDAAAITDEANREAVALFARAC